jgi:hypothetical protein
MLGVSMDDYGTSSIHFDEGSNTLRLFGIATREGNSDSLLFIGDDGKNRKYIFREYHDFLGDR